MAVDWVVMLACAWLFSVSLERALLVFEGVFEGVAVIWVAA